MSSAAGRHRCYLEASGQPEDHRGFRVLSTSLLTLSTFLDSVLQIWGSSEILLQPRKCSLTGLYFSNNQLPWSLAKSNCCKPTKEKGLRRCGEQLQATLLQKRLAWMLQQGQNYGWQKSFSPRKSFYLSSFGRNKNKCLLFLHLLWQRGFVRDLQWPEKPYIKRNKNNIADSVCCVS